MAEQRLSRLLLSLAPRSAPTFGGVMRWERHHGLKALRVAMALAHLAAGVVGQPQALALAPFLQG